ncbi:DUF2607 family protein [Duganella margarita]
MLGDDLREIFHYRQLTQQLGDFAPQHHGRHGGSLFCQARHHGLEERQPGLGVLDRRHVAAKHQRCVQQQEALLGQLALHIGQRQDVAAGAAARLGRDGRHGVAGGIAQLKLAIGHQQHLHEIAQRGGFVDRFRQAATHFLRPQAANRPIHKTDAGGALCSRIWSFADQYILHRIERQCERGKQALLGWQVLVLRQLRQIVGGGGHHGFQPLDQQRAPGNIGALQRLQDGAWNRHEENAFGERRDCNAPSSPMALSDGKVLI